MIRFVALWFLLASVTGAAGYWLGAPASETLAWSSGPTVTHLETLGELVSTKVHIADVLTARLPTAAVDCTGLYGTERAFSLGLV